MIAIIPPFDAIDILVWLLLAAVSVIAFFLKSWYDRTYKPNLKAQDLLFSKLDDIRNEQADSKLKVAVIAEKVNNIDEGMHEMKANYKNLDTRVARLENEHAGFHHKTK